MLLSWFWVGHVQFLHDMEQHGLLAVVKKCSQFDFRCQSNNMFDDGGQGEDIIIINGMFVAGQNMMSTCSALSSNLDRYNASECTTMTILLARK